ncbi:MAG: hypothetical protein IKC26_06220 [Clostridia bacterium]|nr:hypothetical protein [Clostridia bacterium]
MKKLFCLLLVLCVLLSVGCTNTQGGGETTTGPNGDETTADPNGGETTGAQNPPIEYTPQWHLSGTFNGDLLVSYDENDGYMIKIPQTQYEENINGFLFHIDFFEDYYPAGTMMQYRVSITNNTSEDIRYDAKSTIGRITNGSGRSELFSVVYPTNLDYFTDDVDERTLPMGKTVVFECATRVDNSFFAEGDYTLHINLRRLSSSASPPREYAAFSYPVEVKNFNR